MNTTEQATEMAQTNEAIFEPILISRNETAIESETKHLQNEADKLNRFFDMVTDFIPDEKPDLKQLATRRMAYVDEIIPRQFPKADLNFNLAAEGKISEYDNLVKVAAACRWNDGFVIKSNKVKVKPQAIEAITEKHSKYTKNQLQHEQFEAAQRLAEALNEAVKIGLITTTTVSNTFGGSRTWAFLDLNNGEASANLPYIARDYL